MIELSIIIVSYNSGEFLRKCLESIQESKFKNLEVIVVDNASKDNPKKIIKDFPNVIFIKNKENLGFSKANNLGLKKASGKYVLFLNPDTAVGKNALGTLFSFMEENRVPNAFLPTAVSGFRNKTYLPEAFFRPRLFAFENPKFSLFLMNITFGKSFIIFFGLSFDALSTTITSRFLNFDFCIDSKHFLKNSPEL